MPFAGLPLNFTSRTPAIASSLVAILASEFLIKKGTRRIRDTRIRTEWNQSHTAPFWLCPPCSVPNRVSKSPNLVNSVTCPPALPSLPEWGATLRNARPQPARAAMADADNVASATETLSRMRITTRVAPGAPGSIPVVCRYYQAGYCANGAACRFDHPPREGAASSARAGVQRPAGRPAGPSTFARPQAEAFSRPQSGSFTRPEAKEFVPAAMRAAPAPVTAPARPEGNYTGFATAYAALAASASDDEDTDALLRAAAAPATAAPGFLTSVHAAQGSTYAAAAAPDAGSNAFIAQTVPLGRWNPVASSPPVAASSPIASASAGLHSGTVQGPPKGTTTTGPLCRFHLVGDCRYGLRCRYVHGNLCASCGQNALHPYDAADAALHAEICASEQTRKAASQGSETVECGICYEKPFALRRKFGLLQNCDHAFCLACIREWRGSDSAGTFGREAVRMCPVCRTESLMVIPSDTYESDPRVREALLETYKGKLKGIPCRHFDQGRGVCPFGGSCMYAHRDADGREVAAPERPALLVGDSGVRVKTRARLEDFLPAAR